MNILPIEILTDIFNRLDKRDLCNASLVCHHWHSIIGRGDEGEGISLWKDHCIKRWKRKLCNVSEYEGNWKKMCYNDNLRNKAASWEWDANQSGRGISIFGENKVAVYHHSESTRQAICSTPCQAPERYYIEFEITKTQRGALNIGLTSRHADLTQRCGYDKHGWSLSLFSGNLFHDNKWKSYSRAGKTGDRIGMAIDMDKKSVRFFCNGKDLGVAILQPDQVDNGIPDEVFPSVSFGDIGDCVTIVSNSDIPKF